MLLWRGDGLDTHFDVNTRILQNASRDRSRVSDAHASPKPRALLVHAADRRRLLRHVQPNIVRHRNLRWCKPPSDSARIAALSIACTSIRDYPRSTYSTSTRWWFGLLASGCTCGAPSITRARFSTCWLSAAATSGRQSG